MSNNKNKRCAVIGPRWKVLIIIIARTHEYVSARVYKFISEKGRETYLLDCLETGTEQHPILDWDTRVWAVLLLVVVVVGVVSAHAWK